MLPVLLDDTSCLTEPLPCSHNAIANLFLIVVYGFILSQGSKLIADGSELLCEILDPGIIGGFVLPVLGAVPDATIIVVSCLGPIEAVGVGTLAGSTIMLLTIPLAGTFFLGRCDIVNGEAVDTVSSHKLLSKDAWTKSGVSVKKQVNINAVIMMSTTLPYFLIQGAAFRFLPQGSDATIKGEHWFALASFILSAVLLLAYSIYMIRNTEQQKEKFEEIRKRHMMHNVVNGFADAMRRRQAKISDGEGQSLLHAGSANASGAVTEPKIDMTGVGLKWKMKAAKKAEAPPPAALEEGVVEAPAEEVEEHASTAKIAFSAIWRMLVGTALVCLFSDGMVSSITELATIFSWNPFYISFVVTPVASNASELIASLMFAAKKKKVNTSLSVSALFGAATMNNTMCLGIFVAIVFFRKLEWYFSAETLVIILTEVVVGAMILRKTTSLIWAIPIMLVYPLTIALVALLESDAVGWDRA